MADEPSPTPESWEQIVARFARFSGVVGEVDDPLTWGLDLVEEEVTGIPDSTDPTEERFLRSYRTFSGETVEVETLRVPATPAQIEDIVRAACSGALVAPLHADVDPAAPPEITDVDRAGRVLPGLPQRDAGDSRRGRRRAVRDPPVPGGRHGQALHARHRAQRDRRLLRRRRPRGGRDRAVDLVDRVDVVTRPIRNLLHGEDGPRF